MGFGTTDVTDDDRATAADVLRDCEIESAAAKELGKDVGAAVLRELAYSIGLIRAQEREKFADLLRQCIPHIESSIESLGSEIDYEYSHTAAQAGVAAAIDDATKLLTQIQLMKG